MAVDSPHPLYSEQRQSWVQMNDTYEGQKAVKEKGTDYLPATSGQVADGKEVSSSSAGGKAYEAYKERAVFPDVVKDTIAAAVGIMHHKPATIELPVIMEPLRGSVTVMGEGLDMLLRKINVQQLQTGRLGLLPDLPKDPAPGIVLPHIAMYNSLCIINWDDGTRQDPVKQNLNLVVLDESEFVRTTTFEWEKKTKYRVLVLGDVDANEPEGATGLIYQQGVFDEVTGLEFDGGRVEAPSIQGNTLDFIPFTFINAIDLTTDPTVPPLLGLSNSALTIYRGEADYRQSLFMQGQDTLILIGLTSDNDDAIRTGANSHIKLPTGGDAKYIGVESSGLVEQREALRNDREDATRMGVKLMDNSNSQREALETVKIRVAANTATLNEIAMAGALGLQTQLQYIAMWLGADPNQVVVSPNLDFTGGKLTGKELLELIQAKNQGAPISLETIHQNMKDKDLTTKEFEEEVAVIEDELELAIGSKSEDLPDDDDGGEEDE